MDGLINVVSVVKIKRDKTNQIRVLNTELRDECIEFRMMCARLYHEKYHGLIFFYYSNAISVKSPKLYLTILSISL